MIDESLQDDASMYVMGLLSPEEALRFEAAMTRDAELSAFVGRLETGAAGLAALEPARTPPAALRGRILARIRQDEEEVAKRVVPMHHYPNWLPWAIAACFIVLTGTLGYQRYHLRLEVDSFIKRDGMLQGELDHVQARQIALQSHLDRMLARIAVMASQQTGLQSALTAARSQVAELQARDELSQIKIATLASLVKDTPKAMAVVAWDPSAQKGILKTSGMPVTRPDQDYQLWIIDPDYKQPVSAGVFDPDKGARFEPAHPIQKAEKFAISLEKKGGSPAPQGPIMLMGD